MELVRSSVSIASGLPREKVGSAPATVFSRPAQRSLTLRPARSRSRLATLYTESSDSFVASAAASIATGWSEPVPGRELHPLMSSAFHGALFRQQPHRFRFDDDSPRTSTRTPRNPDEARQPRNRKSSENLQPIDRTGPEEYASNRPCSWLAQLRVS